MKSGQYDAYIDGVLIVSYKIEDDDGQKQALSFGELALLCLC